MDIEFLYKNEFLSNSTNSPDKSAANEIFNHSTQYWQKKRENKAIKADADMTADKSSIDKIEFEQLYEEYFSKIYNYIYFCVSNFAVADDLTSDTFYKAYLYLDKYNANLGNRYSWLRAIARNVVNTYFAQSKKVAFDVLDQNIISDDNTEIKVEHRQLTKELQQCIFNMPKKYRELIAMKYILGETNREIAKQTGMSESNVGTTINRIIKKLRKQLKNYV